jgi:hypothetical protein
MVPMDRGEGSNIAFFWDQTRINLRQNTYKYGSTKTLREPTCGEGKGWIKKNINRDQQTF